MKGGILAAVGNTPLVPLERLFPQDSLRIFAKVEGLNPGGSSKDRPALAMLEAAFETGEVRPGTTIVESSSGNMGIGLAQFCAYHDLSLICVVDAKTTLQNRRILEAYGARLEVVTEPDPETGELLQARLQRVQQLLELHRPAYWPNQYANHENAGSHFRTTMAEIVDELGAPPDYLFCATSTCGTLRGCMEAVKRHGYPTRLVAVDAVGSLIFSSIAEPRQIPGLGAGLCPPLCPSPEDCLVLHVSDLDCITGCRTLVRREAILAGGSSGGVVSALGRYRHQLPEGSSCVLILPDRGERYLDSVYSDEWVFEHYGSTALEETASAKLQSV